MLLSAHSRHPVAKPARHSVRDVQRLADLKRQAEPKKTAPMECSWISVRGLSVVFVLALLTTLVFNGV